MIASAHPILAAAGEEAARALLATAQEQRIGAGDPICEPAETVEWIQILLQGSARVFHVVPDGRALTLVLARAPMQFGDFEALRSGPMQFHVTALEDCSILRVPKRAYLDLLAASPAAFRAQLDHAAALVDLSVHQALAAFASLEQRVASLLLAYAQVVQEVDISLEEIAGALGAARRSVTKVLSRLTIAGLVARDGDGRLVLAKRDALEELAGAVHDSLVYYVGRPHRGFGPSADPRQWFLAVSSDGADGLERLVSLERDVLIGRATTCQVHSSDDRVAERHCRIFRASSGGRYWVEAFANTSGTFVNGRPVRRAVLREGDQIVVGKTTVQLLRH